MESARLASPQDVPALAALLEQSASQLREQRGGARYLASEAPAPPYAERLLEALGAPDAVVTVGLWDDIPVGVAVACAVLQRDGDRIAVVRGLYVEEGARGVGVGEAMMELVLDWAWREGCVGVDAVALPGDRETKNFFERFGLVARAILVHRPITGSGEGSTDA